MKRWPPVLWTILIFLLLGALLNLAVAWGCAIWSGTFPLSPLSERIARFGEFRWVGPIAREWPALLEELPAIEWKSTGCRFLLLMRPSLTDSKQHHQFIMSTGIPMRCLYAERHYILNDQARLRSLMIAPTDSWRDGIAIPQWIPSDRALSQYRVFPLQPFWSGLVFNTLFYTVILWLPFQGFFILRRRRWDRRIQEGKCGQCGYIIAPNLGVPGASPNCPECGTPLPEKLPRTSPE